MKNKCFQSRSIEIIDLNIAEESSDDDGDDEIHESKLPIKHCIELTEWIY